MRKILAAVAAAALVTSLAACSSSPGGTDCASESNAGDASSTVTAEGTFGARPTVEFPTPLVTKSIQRTDLDVAEGQPLVDGDFADFQASVWNGATGEFITGTSFEEDGPSRSRVGGDEAFGPILQCVTVGSRIAAVTTLEQLFGDIDASADGLEPTSALVVVIDVQNGIMGKADGRGQIPQAGFPSVVTAPDGTPGVTIPNEEPPTTLERTVLKAGDGERVQEGDEVVLHYEGLSWGPPGSVFESTWETGGPSTYLASEFDPTTGAGLFPGTYSAIAGQRVGSQVLVVVPPEESYDPAAGAAPDQLPADATRIYVFDILDIQN